MTSPTFEDLYERQFDMECRCGKHIVYTQLGNVGRWEHQTMSGRCEDGQLAMPVRKWRRHASAMKIDAIVTREINSSLPVLNYAIRENLPDTAKEVARWMAGVALELVPELSKERHCSYAQKPYIIRNWQGETGA